MEERRQMNIRRTLRIGTAVAFALATAACSRLDMQDQPKYKPQRPSDFFADGRSERPPVPGAIARGALYEDEAYYTGRGADGKDIDYFPIAVNKDLIVRGQQRFDIYCSPCHGRIGNGMGMIVRRGFKQPPSYHTDRLRNAPVGHFYDVMTNGYGAMLNYAAQVSVRDRWAIAAYIRTLQYAENANVNDLPAEARNQIPPPGKEINPDSVYEPLSPPDPDFNDFPNVPATPSGVPGVRGAGAAPSNQPERQ
jgi:mono/diheme cytochrome c family protein